MRVSRRLVGLAVLAARVASAQPAPNPPRDAYGVGAFVAWESDRLAGGALRLDAEGPLRELSPIVRASWLASLGYAHLSDTAHWLELSATVVKLVPAGRLSVAITPHLTAVADAGLGLYRSSWTAADTTPFFGGTWRGTELGLTARLGTGLFYAVGERFRLGVLLEWSPYLGPVVAGLEQSPVALNVGAMLRI